MRNFLRANYFKLTILQRDYIIRSKRLEKLTNVISATSDIDTLSQLEKRVKKELEALDITQTLITETESLITASNDDQKNQGSIPKVIRDLIEKNKATVKIYVNFFAPSRNKLLEKIKAKKYELSPTAQAGLEYLQTKLTNDSFDLKEYHRYLNTAEVKESFKKDGKFASNLKNFNNQVIIHYANVIHTMTREAFLNIPREELLSPWLYENPNKLQPAKYPNLINFITLFNQLSITMAKLILDVDLNADQNNNNTENPNALAERTSIVEQLVWIANYLLNELNDYSSFVAIYATFGSAPINRLKATFEGMSKEAQKVHAENLEKTGKFNQNAVVLKELMKSTEPSIPVINGLMNELTLSCQANQLLEISKSDRDKRIAVSRCNDAGKKRGLVFDVLKEELSKSEFTPTRDSVFEKEVNSKPAGTQKAIDNVLYTTSMKREPRNTKIEPANIIQLDHPKIKNKNGSVTTLNHIQNKLVSRTTKFIKKLDKELPSFSSDSPDRYSFLRIAKEYETIKRRKLEIAAFLATWKEYYPEKLPKKVKQFVVDLQNRLDATNNVLENYFKSEHQLAQIVEEVKSELMFLQGDMNKTQNLLQNGNANTKTLRFEKHNLDAIKHQLKSLLKIIDKMSDLKIHLKFSEVTLQEIKETKKVIIALLDESNELRGSIHAATKDARDTEWKKTDAASSVTLSNFRSRFLHNQSEDKPQNETAKQLKDEIVADIDLVIPTC